MIDAIGQRVMDFVWQGAALALVFFLLERTAGFTDPRRRYGLWCAAMLALVAAPIATFTHHCWGVRNLSSAIVATPRFWSGVTAAVLPTDGERNWLVIAWAVGVSILSFR